MGIKQWLKGATPAAGEEEGGESYMVTPALAQRLQEELIDLALPVLQENLCPQRKLERGELAALVSQFFTLYPQRPLRSDRKGSGFHNLFWLYLSLRLLDPKLIVESGVRHGQSSWVLRQGAPQATIHSFDITLARLVYRDSAIQYHEHDWSELDFGKIDPQKSVAFFDDHIDQARRVQEAHQRGFRWLLMDDNPPAHQLHRFGLAGVPTVAMLLDRDLPLGQEIQWVWRGQQRSYRHTAEACGNAAKLIARSAIFPDVGSLTGWDRCSFLSIVRLVD